MSEVRYAQPEFAANEVEDNGRYPAAEYVDEVVCLNVHRSAAEEHVERQGAPEERPARAPQEEEQHRAHAYMGRGESRRGAFARLLRAFYQRAEETVGTGRGGQFRMIAEVIAHLREVACVDNILAYGVEIILRAGNGQEEVDEIIKEKCREHDERAALKLAAVFGQPFPFEGGRMQYAPT